jgi:hypothetical protein
MQQPMGKTAGTSAVIRPSKRIIYDTTEAVVSFLSENVNTCVDEFLEEWARVSKMVVIAREGTRVLFCHALCLKTVIASFIQLHKWRKPKCGATSVCYLSICKPLNSHMPL